MKKLLLLLLFSCLFLDIFAQYQPEYKQKINKNSTADVPNKLKLTAEADTVRFDFLKKYVQNIDDYRILDSIAVSNQVIFLGEKEHIVEEFSVEKTKIINYLASKHGYKTLVFEADFVKMHDLNLNKSLLSDTLLLQKLSQIWQTKSNLNLIDVIRKNNIAVTGMDFQFKKKAFFYENIIREKCGKSAEKFIAADTISEWYRKVCKVSMSNDGCWKEEYAADKNKKMAQFFKNLYAGILKKLQIKEDNSSEYKITKQAVTQKLAFAQRLLAKQANAWGDYRDFEMLDNLAFIMEKLYPNQKVIVWAHNEHCAKQRAYKCSSAFLGELWQKKYAHDSFVIGLHFFEGDYSTVFKEQYFRQKKVEANSFCAILAAISPQPIYFMDLKKIKKSTITAPFFTPLEEYFDEGVVPKQIILERYDGILFIRKVSFPVFIDFKN